MSPFKNVSIPGKPKKKSPVIAEVLSIEEYAKQELDSYALPEVCNRIRSMLDNEDSTMFEISKVVVLDPSVTLSIMRAANSAIYNFKSKVDTLSKAVTVLGGERIYSMIISEFTMTTFRDMHCDSLDMKRFWTYSFCTAFIAQELARQQGMTVKEQEKIYLCGLIHNVGELAVAKRSTKTAILIEKLMDKGMHPWVAQKEQIGFHYAECSARMMENWGLPDDLVELVRKITCIQPQQQQRSVILLSIAAQCALEMVSSVHFNVDELLRESFDNLEEHEFEMIKTAKRNAFDRSICVVELMDSFTSKPYSDNDV